MAASHLAARRLPARPDGVTPVIAALVSTVSAYALGRVMFTVFGVDFLVATPYLTEIVVAVGSISVLAGVRSP